ncbi:hypothetical protein [Stenotrophomonas pigmentata]|uniref:hypothetical protein n=1 Tax=Stenotrophomonas pigmentata TaxID=3055080 RepID=UPI0026EA6D6C|nr:hypothetical protein [Stenotrophomonas sp. 610A2]
MDNFTTYYRTSTNEDEWEEFVVVNNSNKVPDFDKTTVADKIQFLHETVGEEWTNLRLSSAGGVYEEGGYVSQTPLASDDDPNVSQDAKGNWRPLDTLNAERRAISEARQLRSSTREAAGAWSPDPKEADAQFDRRYAEAAAQGQGIEPAKATARMRL